MSGHIVSADTNTAGMASAARFVEFADLNADGQPEFVVSLDKIRAGVPTQARPATWVNSHETTRLRIGRCAART